MTTVSQFKKTINAKAKLSDFFDGDTKNITFETFFSEAMEKALPGVLDKVLREFMTNEQVMSTVANAVYRSIRGEFLTSEKIMSGIATEVHKNIRKPVDGKDGERGEKGERGSDGKDGFTPQKGVDYFTDTEIQNMVNAVLSKIEPDSGEDIVDKINSLPIEPSKQIDLKHIKGISDARLRGQQGSVHRGGLKLIWDTQLEGTVNGSNTIFTVPASLPDPKDNKFIVSARGGLKTSDDGDFTTSNNNRTITFTSAPPNGSTKPRIILYHGK